MNYTKKDIEWMKRTRRLRLSKLETLDHYFIVLVLTFIPLLMVYDLFTMFFGTYDGARSAAELFFSQIPFLIMALIAYINQRRRLRFKVVRIKYTSDDFREATRRTCESLHWSIETDRHELFRAFRRSNWTNRAGEVITIIKDENMLLLNSVSDPNLSPTFSSFGWDKKNITVFLINLAETLQGIPSNSWFEKREATRWYAKRYMRYLAYFCSIGLVTLSIFLITEGEIAIPIILIGLVSSYIYSDLDLGRQEKTSNHRDGLKQ